MVVLLTEACVDRLWRGNLLQITLLLSASPRSLCRIRLSARTSSKLGTAGGAPVEFYNEFQREADQHDRDLLGKYECDLNAALILRIFFFVHLNRGANAKVSLGNRPVCSMWSHPLSLSISRAISSQITLDCTMVSSRLSPTPSLGIPQLVPLPLSLNGLVLILTLSTSKQSFMRVWPFPFSQYSRSCCADTDSTVIPRWGFTCL